MTEKTNTTYKDVLKALEQLNHEFVKIQFIVEPYWNTMRYPNDFVKRLQALQFLPLVPDEYEWHIIDQITHFVERGSPVEEVKQELEDLIHFVKINRIPVPVYLSKKKITNMTPDELLENAEAIDREIGSRGLGMLFG
jgi:sulfatase maturation enzyme AslB (radical SAM superfamily)